MKRTIPLFITAIGGFVLVFAHFIPMTVSWGENVTVWFDILAAIAFILGGGNLLKMHLKKISDQKKGWGYSGLTLIAFTVMLVMGLMKVGARPASSLEFFGESFLSMSVDDLPKSLTFSLPGEIYERKDGEELPASVRRQLSQGDKKIVFRGWMLSKQETDLEKYKDDIDWRALIEELKEKSQPKDSLKGRVAYYSNHKSLSFKGYMTKEHEQQLLALDSSSAEWKAKIEALAEKARKETTIEYKDIPEKFKLPEGSKDYLSWDQDNKKLTIKGPMTASLRDKLATQPFSVSKPIFDAQRDNYRKKIEELGNALNEEQLVAFNDYLNNSWRIDQLKAALNLAGEPKEIDTSARERKKERDQLIADAKVKGLDPNTQKIELTLKKKVGKKATLNEAQKNIIDAFVADNTMTFKSLGKQLAEAGEFTDAQKEELANFKSIQPSAAERDMGLYFKLEKEGDLNEKQKEYLLAGYRTETFWRRTVGRLFMKSHTEKYPWSGLYRHKGNPFWWLYEYGFKPLTATMFAMLAFYVASAAFRAFRAKNFEAILLLATAFIILLGRTYAGVFLTNSLPEGSPWRIEKISSFILAVFNTAGNRAIMIGIALGLASTSLKILLGVDRSYLGSGED